MAFGSPDGERQAAIGINRSKYQSLDAEGNVELHPADTAISQHLNQSLCGTTEGTPAEALPRLSQR
jgi:hypothetical protein